MRIALAQINTTVGDFVGNSELILARLAQARAQQARIAELGYVVDLHEVEHPPTVFHLIARMHKEFALTEPPAADCRADSSSLRISAGTTG